MNPCALDGTDQRARTVLAACIEPDGPVDADGEHALVHRRCAPPGLPVRWRGGTAVGGGHPGANATAATPPVLVAEARAPLSHDPDVAWLINGLAAKDGIEPSGP